MCLSDSVALLIIIYCDTKQPHYEDRYICPQVTKLNKKDNCKREARDGLVNGYKEKLETIDLAEEIDCGQV